ncbi:ABC transporter ATP-binding protein [candidate division KSB3 bacterium]|uniref:ABC transporter ATP-binding protein n=1 Tax=candidate division KSB3 bacterium TaxID=2044937 RepID=A0A2G6E5L1_9BACT|nr:MAG: ABC transporter ATP-binding protein [candidate division KSB3 bacterium]PIE29889.1 MAG: ABC transporter ATP-binding protein [candidate division KSB3 bacterium]
MDLIQETRADLKLENVVKRFGKVVAVNNVSLEIPHGKLLTLLGPSGCGKTTILRMIAGLESPTSGHIYLGGTDVTHLSPNERKMTMVFQSYALFPHMNVYENIAYGLRVMRWADDRIQEAVNETVRMVGLEGLMQRGASELSGGQQQRVAVARALVLKPKVLLFDEPLSNLDAKLRKHMRGEIRNLQKDLGITSVYVTHDQSEALAISDEIVVMANAVISQKGGPQELYTQPANPFVADFIGEANIVETEVIAVKGEFAQVRLDSLELSVPCFQLPKVGQRAQLVIRPEDIRITAEKQPDGIKGVVKFAQYQGASNDYMVETRPGELSISDYSAKGSLLDRGTEVSLTFREKRLFLIC